MMLSSGPNISAVISAPSESDSLLLVSPLSDINCSRASIKWASPSDVGLLKLPADSVLAADRALSGVSTELTESLDIRWIASSRGREAATAAAAASETSCELADSCCDIDRVDELADDETDEGGEIVGEASLSAGGLYSGGGRGGDDMDPDLWDGLRGGVVTER